MGAPVRDKTLLGTLTTLIVGGAAVLFYLFRVVARLPMFGGNWGPDDWVMTAAMVRLQAPAMLSRKTDHVQILIIPLTICAYLCK